MTTAVAFLATSDAGDPLLAVRRGGGAVVKVVAHGDPDRRDVRPPRRPHRRDRRTRLLQRWTPPRVRRRSDRGRWLGPGARARGALLRGRSGVLLLRRRGCL